MTMTDPVASLIPWYASGTLVAEESARVEAHLAGCDACRDLLALARGFRRLAPHVSQELIFEHVQSQRLVEFAEDPSTLEIDARRFITNHIRTCAVCAEAVEILEDIGHAADNPETTSGPPTPGLPEMARRLWNGVWRWLSRTLLQPAPALAYLVALVVMLVILPLRPPAPTVAPVPPVTAPVRQPAIALLPPVVDLPGERHYRGVSTPTPPINVTVAARADVVPLALVTSLEGVDLADTQTRFRVALVQDDRPVFEKECRGSDFDRLGRLMLFVDPDAFAAGIPCLASIVRVKPGDPADGEVVYRRSFLFVHADADTP